MTEDQKSYDKTITSSEMFKTSAGYGHQKVMENAHKDNFLGRDYDNLKMRLDEELAEFKKALAIFRTSTTDKNAEDFRREGGDVIAIVSAMMTKTAGYKVLVRE